MREKESRFKCFVINCNSLFIITCFEWSWCLKKKKRVWFYTHFAAFKCFFLDLRLRLQISELIHFSNIAMIKSSIYESTVTASLGFHIGFNLLRFCLHIATQFLRFFSVNSWDIYIDEIFLSYKELYILMCIDLPSGSSLI